MRTRAGALSGQRRVLRKRAGGDARAPKPRLRRGCALGGVPEYLEAGHYGDQAGALYPQGAIKIGVHVGAELGEIGLGREIGAAVAHCFGVCGGLGGFDTGGLKPLCVGSISESYVLWSHFFARQLQAL